MSDFLGGRLLIAMPGIDDPRFERAVILVCAHNEQHAMGLALNRPAEGLSVPEVLRRLGLAAGRSMPQDPVLLGGPVESERGFVLHTNDYLAPEASLPLGGGLALTTTRDVLEAMADPNRRPRRSVLALGYAGWGPGQLEREIQQSVWLICEPDEDLLFGRDYDGKWAAALARMGVAAGQLSGQGGRA